MKKILVVFCVATMSLGAFAWHGHGGWHRGGGRVHRSHYHCHGGWGRGGCNFWPGFAAAVAGTVVGAAIADAVAAPRETVIVQQPQVVVQPPPVVVQQPPVVVQQPPVVVQQPQVQQVWVEGCYVDQVQQNGSTVRIWQPGHYEQRTVVR